jgi:hypothetical protein
MIKIRKVTLQTYLGGQYKLFITECKLETEKVSISPKRASFLVAKKEKRKEIT